MEQAQVQHEKALAESKILALSYLLEMAVTIIKDTLKNKHKDKEYLLLAKEFVFLSTEFLEEE